MKIRKANERSKKASLKLNYVDDGNEQYAEVYKMINFEEEIFDLLVIEKDNFINKVLIEENLKEA